MDVAILYSGGKDSTLAIEYALKRKWNIKYLLSIKPNRTDCYLFHYATVEQTKDLAKILGIRHIYTECNVANPQKEAAIVRDVVEKERVDAVLLGGVGLQETQLKTLQRIMMPLNVEVFATHAGLDQDELMEEMINHGYTFMITQVASDGLMKWLGKVITKDNLQELFMDAQIYGFPAGADGGYYDSLVLTCPIFGDKKINIQKSEKIVEDAYCGHIVINKLSIVKHHLTLSKESLKDSQI